MDSSSPLDPYGRPYPPKCGNYYIPHVAADAIVLRAHKEGPFHDILLITRGIEPSKGCLAFPGGHIDYNEAPEDACVRELREECGIEGTQPELFTVRGEATRGGELVGGIIWVRIWNRYKMLFGEVENLKWKVSFGNKGSKEAYDNYCVFCDC